ncbi:hypothetical protein [Polaribacter sp. Asnod1-A03]|uniref:hypothetical protein n=1 Tax=Polaribacter sp. Asnod1-A03 TaxID=3160581 RepID=UPI003866CD27
MKNIFKTFVFLSIIFFQSCTDNQEIENVKDTQIISVDLTGKIIGTATSSKDLNLINSDCFSSIGAINTPILQGYFLNNQGDYYPALPKMDENWENNYQESKNDASQQVGVEFTDEDFFIRNIIQNDKFTEIFGHDNIVDYFDDCNFNGDLKRTYFDNSVPISEVNFNCDAVVTYILNNKTILNPYTPGSLDKGLSSVESLLTIYNTNNNTNYTIDDVSVCDVIYSSTTGNTAGVLNTREQILNYFEDCSYERDIDDALNFEYPLEIKRVNNIVTINNDEELITIFSINPEELVFEFPISLLGENGTILQVSTNDALEDALDNSHVYSN